MKWLALSLATLVGGAAATYLYGESLNQHPEHGSRAPYGLVLILYMVYALGACMAGIVLSIDRRRWLVGGLWIMVLLCLFGRYSFIEQFYYAEYFSKAVILLARDSKCRDLNLDITGEVIASELKLSICHIYVEFPKYHYILKDPSGLIAYPERWSSGMRHALWSHSSTRDLAGCAVITADHLFLDFYYLASTCG